MTFALTKIQPPRRQIDLIDRPALEARLAAALGEVRLVLVCAPAGYGKTALVAQHFARLPVETGGAWIACDENDDLPLVANCLVEALEPFDLPWRVLPAALIGALDGRREPRDIFAAELVNALAMADAPRGLIVIDDLHRIADPAVFEFLDVLIDRLPPRWAVVVASRVEPPLALARWRAHVQMREFRETDLAFTEAEIGTLLPGDARADAARMLLERTGGWPVGMRLAVGSALPGAPASQRHLFDYLASEVLGRLDPDLRRFLLRCAVLPELDEARCRAVASDPQAANRLDEVERRGLFASVLECAPRTLRLHELFREFLEDRLRRESPNEYVPLLRRAAEIEPDAARRIALLLRAGDTEAAAQALIAATPLLLLAGRPGTVLRLLEQFPAAASERSRKLAFARGLEAWQRWDWPRVRQTMGHAATAEPDELPGALVQQALAAETIAFLGTGQVHEGARCLERLRALPLDGDNAALAELAAAWVSCLRGPTEGPGRHLAQMVARLEEGGVAPVTWLRCTPSFLFLGRPGVAAAVAAFVRGARVVAGETHVPLAAAGQVLHAWAQLWHGEVEAAEVALEQADDLARWLGAPRNLTISVAALRLVLAALRGDAAGHRAALSILLADVEHDPTRRHPWYGIYLVHIGQSAAALEDWALLRETLARLDREPDAAEWPMVRHARALLRALWARHEGNAHEVCRLLEPAAQAIDAHGMMAIGFGVHATLALAQARCGRAEDARRGFAPALRLIAGESLVLPMHLLGRGAREELRAAPWLDQLPVFDCAWLQRQLAAPGARVEAASAERRDSGEWARLSPRERDVLARIAAGQSNKLIAKALDLSPHTVKRHVANLFDKTGFASRSQAAAWWHARAASMGHAGTTGGRTAGS
jgi:LuxR family maltose regulon positive regulatory protein